VRGDAGEQPLRRRAQAGGPVLPDQLVVAADAAGGDDDGLRRDLELAGRVAGAGLTAGDVAGLEDGAADAGDRAAADDQLVDAVAEQQLQHAPVGRGAHPAGEGLDEARPGAPDDVEARHRVAVAGGGVAAALGPADDREEADALLAQPRPLLPRGELQVGLGPPARPVVLRAVEAGGAEPVLPGQLERVAHPEPALLGRVDEEQPAEGPPGLPAEGLLGLLVEQDHPLPRIGQLRGGDQPGQPCPHHDDVGVGHVSPRWRSSPT
jgi:hypothetical protein